MSPQPTSIAASPLHVRGRQHSHSVWRRAREVPLASTPGRHQVVPPRCTPVHSSPTYVPSTLPPILAGEIHPKSIPRHPMGIQSCLCGDEHAAATRSCQSSAARAPYPSCAHSPQGTVSARHLRTPRAACQRAHWNESTRCVVWCLIDGRERAWKLT